MTCDWSIAAPTYIQSPPPIPPGLASQPVLVEQPVDVLVARDLPATLRYTHSTLYTLYCFLTLALAKELVMQHFIDDETTASSLISD